MNIVKHWDWAVGSGKDSCSFMKAVWPTDENSCKFRRGGQTERRKL